jgi:branched-chain amino acid transport system substrate-binding protein
MKRGFFALRRFYGMAIGLLVGGLVAVAMAAPQGEPVKIGVIIGLTGPNAVAGNDSLKAMQIAVEEVNQAGGVLGRPLELIVEDNEGRPKAGVEAANKLADVDQVPVVVGGYSSGISLPVGQVLNKKQVVWVTDATTNKLKTVGPFLFNTAGIAEQAVALVDFVHADKPAAKQLAGLFMNNPIGQDRAAVSEARAKELGMTWAHNMMYQVGAKDFRAELQQLIAARPDAILTDIYDNDARIIQRQLFEMGVSDMALFYSYNLGAFGTIEAKLIEGMKGLSYATAGPRAKAFTDKYVAKHGKVYTDAWAPPFYDAVWIVATAINLANGLDSVKIRDAMWPAAYNYFGVSGAGDKGFNQWGMQAADQHSQLVYKDGKMVPYYIGGSMNNIVEFRYADDQGQPRQLAPSAADFKKLYPGQ